MQAKYEEAKKQGLNWQSLAIEETQSELKVLIKDLVLKGKKFKEIDKEVTKVIQSLIKELETESLKEPTRIALFRFATRIYYNYKQAFGEIDIVTLSALCAVNNEMASPQQVKIVEKFVEQDISKAYVKAVPLNMYVKDYMKRVSEALDRIAKMEAKEDYSSRVNLRNIAEIEVRAERHEQELQRLRENGEKLVWIVPHANCSKRCEEWQGKLYSLDGTYGEIDGIEYQPLENATDIYETTKSGKVYKNGCISGFNCRHTIKPYVKGNKPVPIPSKVIDKEREINDKQRYLERGVRLWKERALQYKGIDTKQYVFARNKAKVWNEKYIEYSRENEVAYFPSRTKII